MLLAFTGGPTQAAPGPPPSAGHALVYHDSLGAVLLLNAGLGGHDTPPADTRTIIWRWTGSAWTVLDSLGPPVRNLGGVAYDSRRNALVLFGGTHSSELSYGDTWEWRPDAGWREVSRTGPGKRDHTQMAYDPDLGQTILFGGQAAPDSFPMDTWTWDGTTWRRLAATGPARRVHHAMTYDRLARRVVLFGGISPGGPRLGDTWAWSGDHWVRIAADIAPRTHATMVMAESDVLLLGGLGPTAAGIQRFVDGVWLADSLAGPGARYLTGAAHDPVRQVTVLFGGGNQAGLLNDTWEFAGGRWQRRR